MLTIDIPDKQGFDEATNSFVYIQGCTLKMEHSLASVAKWESKFGKRYFDEKNQKTGEETIEYFRCMTLNENVDPRIYTFLTAEQVSEIVSYINNPMTGTTFSDARKRRGRAEKVSAEILYWKMAYYGIPFECQYWHLNRLMALLRVCDIKNSDGAKGSRMTRNEIYKQNHALNAARRAKSGSRG